MTIFEKTPIKSLYCPEFETKNSKNVKKLTIFGNPRTQRLTAQELRNPSSKMGQKASNLTHFGEKS